MRLLMSCAANKNQQHAKTITFYRAWADTPRWPPSLILAPEGSNFKAAGAVSVMQYDADGFLPEALFTYLARLAGARIQEKSSRDQLVHCFACARNRRLRSQTRQN